MIGRVLKKFFAKHKTNENITARFANNLLVPREQKRDQNLFSSIFDSGKNFLQWFKRSRKKLLTKIRTLFRLTYVI